MSQQDELKWFKDHERTPSSAFTNRRMRRAKTRRKLRSFKQMTDNTKVRSSTISAEMVEEKLSELAALARAAKKGA